VEHGEIIRRLNTIGNAVHLTLEKQMSNYKLNEDAPAFSYTREQLFQCITKIVEHSSSAEARALAIFTVFDDYLTNYCESDNNGGHYVAEQEATDFTDFVRFKLCIDDYDSVSTDDILK
jgi:hypothetical protein